MNSENKNNLFNGIDFIRLMYNGMATGQIIHGSKELIQNGYDKEKLITLLMWTVLFVYSAGRLYQSYKTRKENQENQNNQYQR